MLFYDRLWKSTFYCPQSSPAPFPAPGLQCQPAHGINSWALPWLGSESNLVNNPPVQIVLETDASKSGWGACRNLVKCWLGMDEVFVIKRKQKQTSCLESPEGKGGTAVRKSSTAAPCQARKYKSDKFIHHCSPETKGWAHLALGKQELTPEILVSKRELFHHWYLCNSLFGGEIA